MMSTLRRSARFFRFYLYLAAAFVAVRALIQHAHRRYRWDTPAPDQVPHGAHCRALLAGDFPPG